MPILVAMTRYFTIEDTIIEIKNTNALLLAAMQIRHDFLTTYNLTATFAELTFENIFYSITP